MKNLLSALLVVCLCGCAEPCLYKEVEAPPNVIDRGMIPINVDRLAKGEHGWINPKDVIVFPDESCAIWGDATCWSNSDKDYSLMLTRWEGGELSVTVPFNVKNPAWTFSKSKKLRRGQADALRPINRISWESEK